MNWRFASIVRNCKRCGYSLSAKTSASEEEKPGSYVFQLKVQGVKQSKIIFCRFYFVP
jgi:hypothetical protein